MTQWLEVVGIAQKPLKERKLVIYGVRGKGRETMGDR